MSVLPLWVVVVRVRVRVRVRVGVRVRRVRSVGVLLLRVVRVRGGSQRRRDATTRQTLGLDGSSAIDEFGYAERAMSRLRFLPTRERGRLGDRESGRVLATHHAHHGQRRPGLGIRTTTRFSAACVSAIAAWR